MSDEVTISDLQLQVENLTRAVEALADITFGLHRASILTLSRGNRDLLLEQIRSGRQCLSDSTMDSSHHIIFRKHFLDRLEEDLSEQG